MKPNELRIGNIVLKDDEEIIVDPYDMINLQTYDLINVPIELNEYSPIPLTEEWLIKLGFTNMENICWQRYVQKKWVNFDNGFFFFRVMKHSFAWWFILEDETNTERGINMGDIQYIHELQNLYFALTGEELTQKN